MSTFPQSALRNIYGPEFDRIAGNCWTSRSCSGRVGGRRSRTGWCPPNWDPDRGIEQFATFIELAREEALPLARVPNTDLTYLLLEADDDAARTELLIEHQAADPRGLPHSARRASRQSFLVTQLGRTIDACVAGFHESAQAHAASIIDTALRALFRTVGEEQLELKRTVSHLPRVRAGESVPLRTFRMLPTSVALLSVPRSSGPRRATPCLPIPEPSRGRSRRHDRAVHARQRPQVHDARYHDTLPRSSTAAGHSC